MYIVPFFCRINSTEEFIRSEILAVHHTSMTFTVILNNIKIIELKFMDIQQIIILLLIIEIFYIKDSSCSFILHIYV